MLTPNIPTNDQLVVARGAKGCGNGCAKGFGHKGVASAKSEFLRVWLFDAPMPQAQTPTKDAKS
eukprot:1613830-Amphidinium_carterae.2